MWQEGSVCGYYDYNRTCSSHGFACRLSVSNVFLQLDANRDAGHHELTTAEGESFAYTATAGEIFLRDKKGKKQATIFSIAYTKDGVDDAASRPLAFVFIGGPGSSSVWLHLGLLGPKRVDVPSDGTGVGPPPYRLKYNPRALPSLADLVFVAPVLTGFCPAVSQQQDATVRGVYEVRRSAP